MEPSWSIIDMLLNADHVIKGVMALLFMASLLCWVIIFEKASVLRKARRDIGFFRQRVQEGSDVLACPLFARPIIEAGLTESKDTAGNETRAAFRERVERAMRSVLAGRVDRLDERVLFLATIGSTAPFIGLFGTVWGIMHSFTGIAASGESSLAVVAPGIAEALFATAMGLVAAIPAVMAFNKINAAIKSVTKEALEVIGVLGNQLAREHFSGRARETAPGEA